MTHDAEHGTNRVSDRRAADPDADIGRALRDVRREIEQRCHASGTGGEYTTLKIGAYILRVNGLGQLTATVAQSFRLRFDEPPTYETDGEWNRAKSAEVRVDTLPKALAVLIPGP